MQRELPVVEMDRPWYRMSGVGHNPIYWGLNPPRRRKARFDAPGGEFGVCYLGIDVHCAFIETLGYMTGIRCIDESQLRLLLVHELRVERPLRLVDLTGSGLAKVGADARLCTADFPISQQWSLAFHDHPAAPDGLYYRARHDPSRISVALYDRDNMERCIRATCLGCLLDTQHRALLADILDTYGFDLV